MTASLGRRQNGVLELTKQTIKLGIARLTIDTKSKNKIVPKQGIVCEQTNNFSCLKKISRLFFLKFTCLFLAVLVLVADADVTNFSSFPFSSDELEYVQEDVHNVHVQRHGTKDVVLVVHLVLGVLAADN
jgi:hypothetical protein